MYRVKDFRKLISLDIVIVIVIGGKRLINCLSGKKLNRVVFIITGKHKSKVLFVLTRNKATIYITV